MRRPVVALVLGAVLAMAAAGCGIRAAQVATSGRVMANTSWVCDALDEVLANGAASFGEDFGAMLGHQVAGDRAGAHGSRTVALGELRDLGTDLELAALAANDPVLVAAVAQAVDNLDRLAADQSLLLGVQSLDDMAAVTRQVTAALNPLAPVCA